MVKKYMIACLSLLVSTHAIAFGSQNEWSSGGAQGTTEYIILGQGQSALYFGCSPDANTFVQYTDPVGNVLSSMDNGHAVYASIDGKEPVLINDTFSHAGGSNFELFWQQLRAGKRVVITADTLQSADFSLTGAAKVLPKLEKSDCLTLQ